MTGLLYVGKVSNVREELVLKWVDDDCGALPIKKKNYYRCTHPGPPPPYFVIQR
jgi:hypothetical protein